MFHAPLLTTRNNWNLNRWHKHQRSQNHMSKYAQWNEEHLKKLPLFDSEAMSKAWTIRQSTSLKYNKNISGFHSLKNRWRKVAALLRTIHCFHVGVSKQLQTAVSSVHVHVLENWMQTFWYRGKELLFSCVRLDNMKKMKWGMYCKKYKGPTNQECWLTACSSCFWLWVSLRDAVRSGSTQQQTKDRQTDGQAGHVFLTGFLSAEGDPRVRVTSPIKSQSHACSKCLEGLGICRVGWLDCEAQHAEDWTIMCWRVLTVMQLKCPCAENRRRGEYKEKNKKYEDFLYG